MSEAPASRPRRKRVEDAAGLRRRLVDLRHRRVQRRGAPEEVEADPADVEPQLVVVRALEEHQPVHEVRDEQADDAGDHQVERQAALASVQREPDRHGQEQHVGQRIGHGHEPARSRERVVVDVGGDQPHPRGQGEPHGHDGRVNRGAAVLAPAAAPLQDQHAGDEGRIDREIRGVPERGERDVAVEQQRVAVGVDVAEPEQDEAERDAGPGEPGAADGPARRPRWRARARAPGR